MTDVHCTEEECVHNDVDAYRKKIQKKKIIFSNKFAGFTK